MCLISCQSYSSYLSYFYIFKIYAFSGGDITNVIISFKIIEQKSQHCFEDNIQRSSLNYFCLSLLRIVLPAAQIFNLTYSLKESIPWSMSFMKIFLTYFFIEEIIIIFFITETLFFYCGVVFSKNLELEGFDDRLNFVKVVR